ncbi:ganglioside GM2 activator [Parasteatoda tepidariorum]|uniref:ganglioside GM2 activator n=1 Tax=Parasteatoda tepidariorum TaxID=114398 RepID=UPI001C71FD99|nr:ganglioside GM2 activator [Parasteatoda tepidariorum]
MAIYIYFLTLFIATLYQKTAATDKFIFEDCSKGYKSIVTIDNFSLKPDPISLSRNITVSGNIILHEDVPDGALVKAKFYKVKHLFGVAVSIPVPCVFGYGSCTNEHCKYMSGTKEQICPFFPTGEKCDCPLKANSYSASNIIMAPPDLGPLVKYLASGHFKFEMRILTKKPSKEIACVYFTGKIVP